MINKFILSVVISALALPVLAKVDLVTLPSRETVQLTIYNSADLTLVRESRLLTLKKGVNQLQFSWANTLIDPTSLELMPKENSDKIQIADLAYPPRVQNLGVWTIQSEISGKVPVEITYLTSGLSWRAFYLGILAKDEETMHLEAYVRVTNQSGEDYENAQTRLIVGTIHVLDEIAELASRQYPYGRPGEGFAGGYAVGREKNAQVDENRARSSVMKAAAEAPIDLKKIRKEGLSEYFIYTVEGTETIPTGWSKRLPSFTKDDVPVINLYKFEEQRFGKSVVRFLSFKNDKKHRLGDTPIPGGTLRAFRKTDDNATGLLTYEGQSTFKYIPVDQDVELNMGAVANVIVEPKVMNFKTDNFMFNKEGEVAGWDEIREVKVEIKNTRPLPVKVEITRNFPVTAWDLKKDGDCGDYQKVDQDTVKFTLTLKAQTKKEFRYTLTTRHGTRAE